MSRPGLVFTGSLMPAYCFVLKNCGLGNGDSQTDTGDLHGRRRGGGPLVVWLTCVYASCWGLVLTIVYISFYM